MPTSHRDYVVRRLNAMPGVVCESPGGAFYVFPQCEVDDADGHEMGMPELSSLLLEAGVACLPGDGFGPLHGRGHLRLSYVASMDELAMGLDRMAACLEGLRRAMPATEACLDGLAMARATRAASPSAAACAPRPAKKARVRPHQGADAEAAAAAASASACADAGDGGGRCDSRGRW